MMRLITIVALLAALLAAGPVHAGWEYELGEPLGFRAYTAFHWRDAWLIGSYGAGGLVARSDPWGRNWQRDWLRLPVAGRLHESVSVLFPTLADDGLNLATEDGDGPQLYTWWSREQRLHLTQQWRDGTLYALGGPGAAAEGWLCISSGLRRDIGGRLARWNGERWDYWTPQARDTDGRPLLIWDAAEALGWVVAGAALNLGRYHEEFAGRLLRLGAGGWEVLPTPPMAGVVRLVQLSVDPGWLYLATSWGEIYRTSDLEVFELWQRLDYDRNQDALLFEIEGQRVSVSAAGRLYVEREEVLRIPGVRFMAVAPGRLPDGRWALVGPCNLRDGSTRPVRIVKED